jgi:hypothetical protein
VYAESVSRAVALTDAIATETASGARSNAVLWSENFLAIGNSLAPGIKLDRVQLVPPSGQPGTAPGSSLAILGSLPSGNGSNLKLVSDFIERLSKEPSIARGFGRIKFTGANEAKEQGPPGMTFGVTAEAGGP